MRTLLSAPIPLTILSTLLFRLTHTLPTSTYPVYTLPPLDLTPPLNASDFSNGNCASSTKYPSWSSPDWVIEDCYTAVQHLYLEEVLSHPNIAYEFLGKGASPKRPPPDSQRTPRKYIVRSCVLTIMMLEWFHPGQLPAGKGYNTASTDVSTYRDIWNAARSIENACTVSKSPGWLMTGKNCAMGVFVWATNSHINEITGGFPVHALGLNGSDVLILDEVRTS